MKAIFLRACASIALVLMATHALAQSAGKSGDSQVAYFQVKNVTYSGLRDTHTVALTFDDGPNAYTPAVLDALKDQGVKATFFIVGRMAKAYPEVLARIAAEGHLLGNHSATHPVLGGRYDEHPQLLLNQIRQVDDQIAPLMPAGTLMFFRAPYGAWRVEHAELLNADPVLKRYIGPIYWDEGGEIAMSDEGYILSAADWSCWHRGWDATTCAKGYLREIRRKDGGVVIMHCIHAESAALVNGVVPALIEEGYKFVRLDQVPSYLRYQTPPSESEPTVAANDGRIHMASAVR
jgi:peptidoglycan/xylan/chitin deacetylase (PgdA/CDA1 family)